MFILVMQVMNFRAFKSEDTLVGPKAVYAQWCFFVGLEVLSVSLIYAGEHNKHPSSTQLLGCALPESPGSQEWLRGHAWITQHYAELTKCHTQ